MLQRRFINEREEIIRLWFDMWIKQAGLGIDDIFTDDVIYTESWGSKYENRKTVKHWFDEWNTRDRVLLWEIKQSFHQGNIEELTGRSEGYFLNAGSRRWRTR